VNPAPNILPLVGPSRFDRIDTMKTVSYYKYATTLFDVIRRSMPYTMPKTLTNEEPTSWPSTRSLAKTT